MVRNFDDAQNLGKDNLDATIKSFGVVSKGFQAIAADTADYAKKAFEDGTAASERLFAAKSFDKAIEVQTDYLKTAYEGFVSQATKVGQLYADVFQEAYKPFESQWTKTTATR
ncbi:MAG: phasin family protein [Xanthobacteraceae bacterium]